MNIEEIRNSLKPQKIDILFIGESPPHNGKFFYCGDSPLYSMMNKVFSNVYKSDFHSDKEFLLFFKSHGYFLDDLCHEPVNHLPNKERREKRKHAIDLLANRLIVYSPKHIIIFMKAILKDVESSIQNAGISCLSINSVPFPNMGNQTQFRDKLISILEKILNDNKDGN